MEHTANQLKSREYLNGPKYLPPLACLSIILITNISTHISLQTAVQIGMTVASLWGSFDLFAIYSVKPEFGVKAV